MDQSEVKHASTKSILVIGDKAVQFDLTRILAAVYLYKYAVEICLEETKVNVLILEDILVNNDVSLKIAFGLLSSLKPIKGNSVFLLSCFLRVDLKNHKILVGLFVFQRRQQLNYVTVAVLWVLKKNVKEELLALKKPLSVSPGLLSLKIHQTKIDIKTHLA